MAFTFEDKVNLSSLDYCSDVRGGDVPICVRPSGKQSAHHVVYILTDLAAVKEFTPAIASARQGTCYDDGVRVTPNGSVAKAVWNTFWNYAAEGLKAFLSVFQINIGPGKIMYR
jgi:hypothetical protein